MLSAQSKAATLLCGLLGRAMMDIKQRRWWAVGLWVVSLGCQGAQFALVADRVIDGDADEPLEQVAVLVDDARITGLVDIDAVSDSYKVISLPGQTLMPGMINGHEHPRLYADDYQNAHLTGSSA